MRAPNWLETGDLALYVGVVGAFVEAPFEIPVGQESQGNDGHQGEKYRQAAFELGRHGGLSLQKCK